ncbi:hypothetical protein PR002_g9904 [Phytophthora rubi]|uniref:Uncharacterized protein n=1 Tax=Phytophthora rubi TaxID=129364 RepID=A0A6A3MFK7_9STRA|nr:hypothetical protein PR002_g9904 [Phytophthora rubi]
MKLFVVAARADQSSGRLLVLGQGLSVGADERMRGGRGSLQGAQIHLQRVAAADRSDGAWSQCSQGRGSWVDWPIPAKQYGNERA